MYKHVPVKLDWLPALALMALVVALRLSVVGETSITQDESTMMLFAQGTMERGYPFLYQGAREFIISTYELVPYPIALSFLLLGESVFALRMPAVIFAGLTSLVLYFWTLALFGRRAAFIATLIYALLPWTIYWGSNGFYPSQLQFFALLTLFAVHRLLADLKAPPAWFYVIVGLFFLTYLTWEGSGFLLPVVFLTALILCWGRWHWIASWHAWIAGGLIVLGVVAQLTYRTLLREPYLGIGSSRSDVSFAQLAIFNTDYDPFFYLRALISESHLLLAALFLFGVCFLHRSFALRYLYLVVLLSALMLTSALGYYALRYFYFMAPLALMACAAILVMSVDALAAAVKSYWPRAARCYAGALLGGTTLLLVFTATPWLLKPSQALTGLAHAQPRELRQELSGFGFNELNQTLMRWRRSGDVVIVQAPFPLRAKTGFDGDYFLQTRTMNPVFYRPEVAPYYADRWVGNPVLRNRRELEDVLQAHARVWVVSVPDGAVRSSVGADLHEQLLRRFEVVKETADGRLLLWQNPNAP